MDKISITLEPVDNNRLMNLCGPLNNNIKELEMRFNVEINQRGGSFILLVLKRILILPQKPLKSYINQPRIMIFQLTH